jgi:hypothetical protein
MEEAPLAPLEFFCAEMENGSFIVGLLRGCDHHGVHGMPLFAFPNLANLRCMVAVLGEAMRRADNRAGLPTIVRLGEEILQAASEDMPGIPGGGL